MALANAARELLVADGVRRVRTPPLLIITAVADGMMLRMRVGIHVCQRRPENDVEVVVVSIEGLAVSLRTAPARARMLFLECSSSFQEAIWNV